MATQSTDFTRKLRAAVKAKLEEYGLEVDEELPDYVMIMVGNKKDKTRMKADLKLFLTDNTSNFVDWLFDFFQKIKNVTAAPPLALPPLTASGAQTLDTKAFATTESGRKERISAEHDVKAAQHLHHHQHKHKKLESDAAPTASVSVHKESTRSSRDTNDDQVVVKSSSLSASHHRTTSNNLPFAPSSTTTTKTARRVIVAPRAGTIEPTSTAKMTTTARHKNDTAAQRASRNGSDAPAAVRPTKRETVKRVADNNGKLIEPSPTLSTLSKYNESNTTTTKKDAKGDAEKTHVKSTPKATEIASANKNKKFVIAPITKSTKTSTKSVEMNNEEEDIADYDEDDMPRRKVNSKVVVQSNDSPVKKLPSKIVVMRRVKENQSVLSRGSSNIFKRAISEVTSFSAGYGSPVATVPAKVKAKSIKKKKKPTTELTRIDDIYIDYEQAEAEEVEVETVRPKKRRIAAETTQNKLRRIVVTVNSNLFEPQKRDANICTVKQPAGRDATEEKKVNKETNVDAKMEEKKLSAESKASVPLAPVWDGQINLDLSSSDDEAEIDALLASANEEVRAAAADVVPPSNELPPTAALSRPKALRTASFDQNSAAFETLGYNPAQYQASFTPPVPRTPTSGIPAALSTTVSNLSTGVMSGGALPIQQQAPTLTTTAAAAMAFKSTANAPLAGTAATSAARPMTAVSTAPHVIERCRFWPDCHNEDVCPFHHPTKPCATFPKCWYGKKCLFVHPPCKFGKHCVKPMCPFTHYRTTQPPPPNSITAVIVPPPGALTKVLCALSSTFAFFPLVFLVVFCSRMATKFWWPYKINGDEIVKNNLKSIRTACS